jgi:hypothetical protein
LLWNFRYDLQKRHTGLLHYFRQNKLEGERERLEVDLGLL